MFLVHKNLYKQMKSEIIDKEKTILNNKTAIVFPLPMILLFICLFILTRSLDMF